MQKAAIISLGCPRNLVDSENILGTLKEVGFKIVEVEDEPDVCIINTCAFVSSAREESVDAILEAAHLKDAGKIKKLVICGCLPQLYKEKLSKELSEADLIIGTSDIPNLKELIKNLDTGKQISQVSKKMSYLYDENSPRFSLTPKHYAYVKISEGCDNSCSYCIISKLRGPFRSRKIESVVEEVAILSKSRALKEINLIGQDTTLFGMDRNGKFEFAGLLRQISSIKNSVEWIRVLYTHPAHYTDELIKVIASEDKICKYLDFPIQHISDTVLKRMNRPTKKSGIIDLIENLRKNIKELSLRTSIIVGFPGETDKDFMELLKFLEETRFERLGAFIYSKEDGTRAAAFKNQVPEKIKKERLDELMKLQQNISLDINKSMIGKEVQVLIDEEGDSGEFIGRTYRDAPEIDCSVRVCGKRMKIGEFCSVKIKDALEYDLIGDKI